MKLKLKVINIASLLLIPLVKIITFGSYFLGRIYYTALLKSCLTNVDPSVQCDGSINIIGTGKISLGEKCRLGKNTELNTQDKGGIHLGHDVRISRGCTITSYSSISIGDYSIIGEYTSIRDANHGMAKDTPMRYQPHSSSPIRIGRDVWIGRGCCILPGVSIGDGTVIGANSVVTKNISAGVIAAGVPAVVIKER